MCNDRKFSKIPFHVLVVVAHPDDETLWVGGMMLMHPQWRWKVVSLSRGEDTERRTRFFNVMKHFGANGRMFNLDDGPMQHPLSDHCVQETISQAHENITYDLVVTHSPFGEYSRHLRHEEVGRNVLQLWKTNRLCTKKLWLFAYSDNNEQHCPKPIDDADLIVALPNDIWHRKRDIIQKFYNFSPDSWETLSTPRAEAFWCFDSVEKAIIWQKQNNL